MRVLIGDNLLRRPLTKLFGEQSETSNLIRSSARAMSNAADYFSMAMLEF
jgi:hypothetical protein